MKRALAERAKQETNEQQLQQRVTAAHHLSGHHLPGGGTLGPQDNTNRSSSTGTGIGAGTASAPFAFANNGNLHSVKEQRQQQLQLQLQQQQQREKVQETYVTTHPSGGGTPPPLKIPRTEKDSDKTVADGSTEKIGSQSSSLTSPLYTTEKKTSKKRIRPPASVMKSESAQQLHQQQSQQQQLQDLQNGEESSAFFLKHQNKALASELYQYRHMIGLLSKERDKRRQECRKISNCLKELVGVWDMLEGELCTSLGRSERLIVADHTSSMELPQDIPASTGNGTHVEGTQQIIQSILSLISRPKHSHIKDNGREIPNEGGTEDVEMNDVMMSPTKSTTADADADTDADKVIDCQREMNEMEELSKSATAFSMRCQVLHKLILEYVRNASSSVKADTESVAAKADMEIQLHSFRGKLQDLEVQMQELAKARDEANERERRVRRGVYRVATGRLDIGEVLKAVEKDSTSTLDEISELEQDILGTAAQQQIASVLDVGAPVVGEKANDMEDDNAVDRVVLDGKVLTSADVQLMKKKMDDLMHVTETKDKRLAELVQENFEKDKTINSLIVKDKDATDGNGMEKDIRSSALYIEISQKLSATERKVESLTKELSSVMERWAVTKGDLESYQNTIKDLEEKHSKRLKELMGDDEEQPGNKTHLDQAKLVMELEHKLKHALDNVRQSESIKISLADSQAMNETLQRRIGELKTLNDQLEAEVRIEGNGDPQDPGHSKDKLSRMKREYSELKHKYEQNEKERTSLVSMNMRLQQQSIEKDDMNAKSLSTILHLKQISEKLEEEKDSLEKNLKSAQQLALAARLAANAKTRVEEEAMREKADVEEQLKQIKSSLDSLQKDKNDMEETLAIANAKVESSMLQMNETKKRCDELLNESIAKEQRYQKMEEELVIAKKDLIDAAQKAATAQTQHGNSSGSKFETAFTAEELTIQVNQLKSRLACPVCNTRDKKVIITRCRHMFCRNCVAANLEGRNRKCPSCGIKFDKKDVEDVWF